MYQYYVDSESKWENTQRILIKEAQESFKSLVTNEKSRKMLFECFHYAWQNEESSANDLAKYLGLEDKHLYAIDGNLNAMKQEILEYRC